MIAVYYEANASPFTMYLVSDVTGDHVEFIDNLGEDYPFSSADVLFIDNDKIVDQWRPIKGVHRELDLI